MKELNYKASGANKTKIAFAKRKQVLARIIGIFILALTISSAIGADFSKIRTSEALGGASVTLSSLPFIFMKNGKFEELKGEELATFLKDGEPDAIAKYYEELNKVRKEALDKAIEAKASKEDLDKLKEEFTDSLNKRFESLQDALKAQGLTLAKMLEKGSPKGTVKTLAEEIKENFTELKAIAKDASSKEIELKAVTERSSIANNQQAFDLMDIGQLAHRKLTAYEIFPKLTVSSSNNNGVIRYYDWDEDTIVRAAVMIAEKGTFPESTAKFKKGSITIQKVGDTLPVTEEFFEDEQMFAAELQMFLVTNVDIKVDDQIINGDGTGNNIKGLLASIDAFDATTYADSVKNATTYDLIVKVHEDIVKTGGSKYSPDVAIMNITDINNMMLSKDKNGNYILPPFVSRDGSIVKGMTVVECNALTADSMVVCDRKFGRIYEYIGLQIARGYSGTQFVEDEMTLKVRKRLAFLVRAADKGGFRKVTSIAADVDEITEA